MKFLDLGSLYSQIKPDFLPELEEFLESGEFILGEKLTTFEESYAHSTDSKYCIGTSNGLDSLRLALMSLGVEPESEIIVPAHTFIATWLAASSLGAKLVPVDCELTTFNLDISQIYELITSKTKAIIITSMYGHPLNYDAVRKLKSDTNIPIIEDAAQAHCSSFRSTKTGSFCDLTAWSFYPGKNLGAFGDAGAITTNSESLYRKLLLLRNYGSDTKYVHETRGLNLRLDPLQALVLTHKLKYLPSWHERRTYIASRYLSEINNPSITLPLTQPDSVHAWHLFVVLCEQRNLLQQWLADCDVPTLIHYPTPIHHQNAYCEEYGHLHLPHAERIASTCLSLPIGPHLNETDIERVIHACNSYHCS